jgi:cytochrome P450
LNVAANDMVGLMTWILWMLATHPEWAARLREETRARPETSIGSGCLADRIVSETLRLEQSEHVYRRTTRALPLGDHVIPEGWLVRLCIRESHRDAAIFPRPDEFDPDRFLPPGFGPDEYMPFGAFGRACPGQFVARTMAGIFAVELTAGYDVSIVRHGRRELSRALHWAPGRTLRVAIKAIPKVP